MFKPIVRRATALVERFLPDPYVFVLLLTMLTAIGAIAIEHQPLLDVLRAWGGGFWGLLTFSMQMLLVLLTGYMLASTPPVRWLLSAIARVTTAPAAAVALTTLVSMIAAWINWGFGLVVGALFAKEVARHTKVDYRVLIASAYSAFIVWHGGLSGSIPLAIATEDHFMTQDIGVISTQHTLFATFNIVLLALLLVLVPLVNVFMMSATDDPIFFEPEVPPAEPELRGDTQQMLQDSTALSWLVGFAGLVYLIDHFIERSGQLDLNTINFTFLTLAILLHRTPRRLLASLHEGIKGGAGIILQFPFYAGIMAMMKSSGLAATISTGFASFATATTLPMWAFLSAGLVNLFVPSGGGQWAVQAPVIIPAAQALHADIPRVAMAVAWGDAWTNLLQPFWALPALAIAGLRTRDIMGFCFIQLVITGVFITLVLTFV